MNSVHIAKAVAEDLGSAGRNMEKYGESVFKDGIVDRKEGRGTA